MADLPQQDPVSYPQYLSRQIIGMFLLCCVVLSASLIHLERQFIDNYIVNSQLEKHTIGGQAIVEQLQSRLLMAESLAGALEGSIRASNNNEALLRNLLPAAINRQGYALFIAGGGYWPVPGSGNVSRNYFWKRNLDGELELQPKAQDYSQEEWFVAARYVRNGHCFWSAPFMDSALNRPIARCSIPMQQGTVLQGVITVDIRLDELGNLLDNAVQQIGGYGLIMDRENRLIHFPQTDSTMTGQKLLLNNLMQLVQNDKEFSALAATLDSVQQELLADEHTHQGHWYGMESSVLLANLQRDITGLGKQGAEAIAAQLCNMSKVDLRMTAPLKTRRSELQSAPMLNEPVYANILVMPSTLWKIVIATPVSYVTMQADANFYTIMKFTMGIIIAAFVLFILFLRASLLRPIQHIIRILKSKNQTAPLDESLKNELGEIAYWYNRRTQEMVQAREMAEKEARHKSQFLAHMSHELRTPLNGIIGMANLMKEEPLTQEQQEMIGTLNQAALSLLEIVNDVLDFSKIESGQFTLERIPFSPAQAALQIINILTPVAHQRGLTIEYDLQADIPPLMGDPTQFSRVIANLLSNAVKYTEKGTVKVAVRFAPSGEQRGVLTASIHDTGIGIPQHKIKQIFEQFVQADSSTTRKYGGSGLGLTITREIVTRMNGQVHVTSAISKGSCFTATLPLDVARTAPLDNAGITITEENAPYCPLPSGMAAAHVRVLVAEDHLLNQIFTRRLLKTIGFTHIQIVDNGEAALDAARKQLCDIILMDCNMPVMSGYEATRAIRRAEKETGQHMPIIAVTANATLGEREHCISCGMDEYLSKPVDKKILITLLSRWIDLSHLMQQTTTETKGVLVPVQQLPVLNLEYIREYSQGNAALEREFATTFVDQAREHILKLEALCAGGHSDAWKEYAHLLKGGAATMGAVQLRELCARAQTMVNATLMERRSILDDIKLSFSDVYTQLAKEDLILR
jgi:signal transduction histidine kinase/CheY-like chemotaxis protein